MICDSKRVCFAVSGFECLVLHFMQFLRFEKNHKDEAKQYAQAIPNQDEIDQKSPMNDNIITEQ